MHFWKKRLQRAAALFCTLALCAGMVPSAAFAQEPSTAAQVSLTQQSDSQGAPEGETTPPESTPAGRDRTRAGRDRTRAGCDRA